MLSSEKFPLSLIEQARQNKKDFAALVHSMRCSQKKYFETRDKKWLIKAKELERQVDSILEI